MAIIFDSNVWIALFNENDAHHENARQLEILYASDDFF
jgi:predicted nucleic acid-binding protein